MPFWYPAVIDWADGGYRLNHDIHGNWRGPANKQLLAQTRKLYSFSGLARSPYGSGKYLEAARHGYEFLPRRMWDQDFRGFYWETDSVGKRAIKPKKHLCGQAYGLFAISEYFQASADPSANELCDELFDVCEEHAHDLHYGGYQEFFEPNWSLAAGNGREYMGVPASVKLLPTHLHLLEAVTSYSRISNRLIVKERLTELILVLVSALAQKGLGVCTETYERNWRPSQGTDQLSYGHLLKSIWILVAGCDAAAKPNAPFVNLYQTIFRRVLDHAFDRGKGGFYELGRFDRPVRRGAKAWWVQAESLMCAMKMYLLTNEKTYWDCFSKSLEWIAGYQVDWKRGDWYWEIGIDVR